MRSHPEFCQKFSAVLVEVGYEKLGWCHTPGTTVGLRSTASPDTEACWTFKKSEGGNSSGVSYDTRNGAAWDRAERIESRTASPLRTGQSTSRDFGRNTPLSR